MTQSDQPVARWRIEIKPVRFHLIIPQWRIMARATFELVPDFADGVFLSGTNIRRGSLSLMGYGTVEFLRPLSCPFLRAYTMDSPAPIQFLEVTQYSAQFKIARWPVDDRRTEEIVFECQQM
jgi:hypothetical protein